MVVFLQPALYLLHLDGEVVSRDAMRKGELFHLRRGCRGDTVSCSSDTARAQCRGGNRYSSHTSGDLLNIPHTGF